MYTKSVYKYLLKTHEEMNNFTKKKYIIIKNTNPNYFTFTYLNHFFEPIQPTNYQMYSRQTIPVFILESPIIIIIVWDTVENFMYN